MKYFPILAALVIGALSANCSSLPKRAEAKSHATHDAAADRKLTRIALEMLTPSNSKYDPEKGRAYLEYALKQGTIKDIEIPAPTLLEILKAERLAAEKSQSLEQQLEIMKAIDLNKEDAL